MPLCSTRWRASARREGTGETAYSPFKLGIEFVRKALDLTTGKVAMLARLAFLEGAERRELYDSSPIARVWVFSKRIQMLRSGIATSDNGGMVAFAWFVWEHGYRGQPTIGWL